MLRMRLPDDVHVLPAVRQARGRQSRTLRFPVHDGEHHVAHVLRVPLRSRTAVPADVRREAQDDVDSVPIGARIVDNGVFRAVAHRPQDRPVGIA